MEGTDGLELSGFLGSESEADSNTVDVQDSHAFSINSPVQICRSISVGHSEVSLLFRRCDLHSHFSGKTIQAREGHLGILFSFVP